MQQIQASEGQPALIQIGQSIPITSTSTDGYGRIQSDTEYRNVTQGFYVTPSLSGDTVRLQISTNNDRMSLERQDVVKFKAPTRPSPASSASGSPWPGSISRAKPNVAPQATPTAPNGVKT